MEFRLNEKEKQEYKEFCQKHHDCEFTSTIGGKIAVTFEPTGLGSCILVKCNACGETKDITDTSCW